MANSIPDDMKRATVSRIRTRYVFVGSLAMLLSAFVAFALLVPSYLMLRADAYAGARSTISSTQAQQTLDSAAIAHTNGLLAQLAPLVVATSTPTNAIAVALAARPAGVHVDQITYTAGAIAGLMLFGSADTSSEISAYRNALAAKPLFASVSVPVGALVGTDGGRFSIRLSGAF
jgi:hypothetical protein